MSLISKLIGRLPVLKSNEDEIKWHREEIKEHAPRIIRELEEDEDVAESMIQYLPARIDTLEPHDIIELSISIESIKNFKESQIPKRLFYKNLNSCYDLDEWYRKKLISEIKKLNKKMNLPDLKVGVSSTKIY